MAQFTLAAAGDAILTRRLSAADDGRLDSLVERLRAADASVVNLEVLLHDYEGYPAAESGGTYIRAPPWVADELSWAGFDLFAAATNHTGDFGRGGMEATMRTLETRDLPYAGLGRTLSEARAPAYVDTPGGRVALVAACSTVTGGSAAGEQRPDMRGRPGLSPLSLSAEYVVPEETYDRLGDLSGALGMEAFKRRRAEAGFPVPGGDEEGEGLTLLNAGRGDRLRFVPGDDYRVDLSPSEADREAVLARVRAAARQADWVVASLHAHEGGGVERNDRSVAPFVESFARDCVDAGADAFVGHGPHLLRGMEVYAGAPVFYSLGNFAMQNETVTRLPAELYDRYDLDPQRTLPADLFDARVRRRGRTGGLPLRPGLLGVGRPGLFVRPQWGRTGRPLPRRTGVRRVAGGPGAPPSRGGGDGRTDPRGPRRAFGAVRHRYRRRRRGGGRRRRPLSRPPARAGGRSLACAGRAVTPVDSDTRSAMARNFSDDDRDKPVYTAEGTRIGTVHEVEGERARVRRGEEDESLTDEIRDLLGWNDDDESHELRGDQVDRYEENGVHLHGRR